jgi:GNAT superfamily N-acetyltransferase
VPTITIRAARADDVAAMFEMLRASAAEQGHPQDLCVDVASLREDGFGASPRFDALIAEDGGRPAGLALYGFNYSTWTSRNGVYLEDLYVRPESRHAGIARALMVRLHEIAVERGCGRFQWIVQRDNAPAVRFYESLGAKALAEWQLMAWPKPVT